MRDAVVDYGAVQKIGVRSRNPRRRTMRAFCSRICLARCVAALLGLAVFSHAGADETATADSPAVSQGLKPSLNYQGAAFANLGGGVHSGATYSSNLHLQLDVDAARLLGWPDTLAYLDVLWLQGGLPSNFVGDAQGVSSISAPNSVKVYEAWIQKNFLENRVSVLAGLYDLNSEFYRLQSAGLFFNSSFGIGPEFAQSGVEGPSIFPDTSVGLRLAFKPVEGVVLRGAILDGVPLDRPNGSHGVFEHGDGALLVAEVDFLDRPLLSASPSSSRLHIGRRAMLGEYETKIGFGAWYYTAAFDDLSETQSDGRPVRHRGSGGLYLVTDQLLYRHSEQPERELTGFLQAGVGDYRVDRFGSYLGIGLNAAGAFAGRPADQLGLALAYARNGSHYMSAQHIQGLPVTSAERTIEFTYLIQVNSWLAIQPDLQYVITPNTTPTIPNALAFQLRLAMSF